MTKGKKYGCRIVKDGSIWNAEIIRRITSKKTVVSKSQGGFTTESEAQEWGNKELEIFSMKLKEQNKLRSELRKREAEKAEKK